MEKIKNRIICGDALDILKTLPDGCCRCCITSPPYYRKRDYGEPGQIGLEDFWYQYIDRLAAVFKEVKRCLKPDGSLWVIIDDTYHNKDLLGIPWRLAFKLKDLGFILRGDDIWYQTNGMPESVQDRCMRTHEYIFQFAKRRDYFFNSQGFTEQVSPYRMTPVNGSLGDLGNVPQSRRRCKQVFQMERESRRRRSIWTVSVGGNGIRPQHYGMFPEKLIEPCILSTSKEGDVILDPFCGSGTTCRVANKFNRKFIGIDINKRYCDMAAESIPINLFKEEEEENER